MFTIEKNVPVPEKTQGNPGKYRLNELENGDSFFVPAKDENEAKKVLNNLNHAAYTAAKKSERNGDEHVKFTVRLAMLNGTPGARIWRVK